jgi:Bor protein
MKSLAMLLAIAMTGCWATTVHSGKAPGAIPDGWNDRWHSGLLFGSVELSGPYDLNAICPRGWSEVRTRMSALNAILTVITFDIYSTQTITVVCAE